MASGWAPKKHHPWFLNKQPKGRVVAPSPAPAFGELIHTLRVEDLEEASRKHQSLAQIQHVQTVTSYSWVEKKGSGPTILVPGRQTSLPAGLVEHHQAMRLSNQPIVAGKPPLWTPKAALTPLKEDSGSYFRDKNAARYPSHPLEPAIVAALAADPALPAQVDIFACGSTVGNLLRFARGQEKTSRMLAYKAHNTVFLVRRENSPTELIPDVRGYGHTFPEANTTWEPDVKGSASHQRLIRYTFGGLDLVVRFEADGYIKPRGSPTPRPHTKTTTPSPSTTDEDPLTSLTTSLTTTTLSHPVTDPTNPATLTIIPSHTPIIPHAHLFDLKTRSIHSRHTKNHLADELPRLWVSRIPTFILAFHTRGLFHLGDVEIKDTRGEVEVWEREHAEELGRLAGVLYWLRGVVEDEGVEVCMSEGGGLEVRRIVGVEGGVAGEAVRKSWVKVGRGEEEGAGVSREDGNEKVESDAEEEVWWDDGETKDFTACGQDCGYCGNCTY